MVAVETRKAQLEARLAELSARLHRIDDELDQPVSESFSEQAVEREEEEVLEDLGAAGLREVRMIEAALDRIGAAATASASAAASRSATPPRRVPHTPFCRDCAAGR